LANNVNNIKLIKNDDGTTKTISNKHSKGTTYSAEPLKNDTFKFRIVNLAKNPDESQGENFPAYIQNFNESISPSWNNISFINRSEDIYIYQRAERSFNLEFFLFATVLNEGDIIKTNLRDKGFVNHLPFNKSMTIDVIDKKTMWRKINFIQSLARPKYVEEKYNKAPYCRIWLGDLIKGQLAIIDGININYDPLIWDLNDGDIKPMIAMISLTGKLLHNTPPSVDTNFYRDFEVK